MVLKQLVKFLRERAKLGAVCIFDHCGSHDRFEELTLEDDSKFKMIRVTKSEFKCLLMVGMDVIGLDSEFLVEFFLVDFFLVFFTG